MTFAERRAQSRSYLGKIVKIGIDRPIGYVHKKAKYDLVYPINYGYIPDVLGGDGEELDVYLLGVDEPVEEYTCRIIGVAHRLNDVEDKLEGAALRAIPCLLLGGGVDDSVGVVALFFVQFEGPVLSNAERVLVELLVVATDVL